MRRDGGSAAPVVVGLVALLAVLAMLLADVGRYLAVRSQAIAAADAAALAAAPVTFRPYGAPAGPRGEAMRFAAANGAVLVSCRCPMDPSFARRRVEVVVAAGVDLRLLGTRTVTATSRAEFDPVATLASP